jgi:hypothetical protein
MTLLSGVHHRRTMKTIRLVSKGWLWFYAASWMLFRLLHCFWGRLVIYSTFVALPIASIHGKPGRYTTPFVLRKPDIRYAALCAQEPQSPVGPSAISANFRLYVCLASIPGTGCLYPRLSR